MVINFTDSLVKLFSNQHLSLAAARNSGLALFDLIPGAKKQLARALLHCRPGSHCL
jgi:2-octaprenyl-6-methoxyphenol hydroxylase